VPSSGDAACGGRTRRRRRLSTARAAILPPHRPLLSALGRLALGRLLAGCGACPVTRLRMREGSSVIPARGEDLHAARRALS